MIEDLFELTLEMERGKNRSRLRPGAGRLSWPAPDGFKCAHCRTYVSCEPLLAGVQNRNHCPYCLWSRHLDLERPGDRLAACREKMQPVGLTLKRRPKKYGTERGELMLIHVCLDCGKVSINRIAADDLADRLFEVFEASLKMERPMRTRLEACGVEVLGKKDRNVVSERLFGLS